MNHKKLLLTLTLCLCALLCMVVTASASEVSVHSHPVCGKTHIDIGDHTTTPPPRPRIRRTPPRPPTPAFSSTPVRPSRPSPVWPAPPKSGIKKVFSRCF